MIQELDTRTIYGNGGRVVWGFEGTSHVVSVLDISYEVVSVLSGLEPAEAAVAFWHTFADPRVPDIFARTPETLLVESQDDDEREPELQTPFGPARDEDDEDGA